MPAERKPTPRKLQINDSLPTLYIDGAAINHRNDKMSLVRLTVTLPNSISEQASEQARIMVSDEDLQRIIDDFCKAINYYPEKSRDIKKKATKNI